MLHLLFDLVGAALLFWALFMNAEDGFFGHYPHTFMGAVKWWARNPCHNLCFHVLRWKSGPFWRGMFLGRYWYFGWRPDSGALGAAWRKKPYGT